MTIKHCALLALAAMVITYYGIANVRFLRQLEPELTHT